MVNHVGSTGYGRAYCSALNGSWGIADIDEATRCVAYLRQQGQVDDTRVGIVGESAGGYAFLQALYLYLDLWIAGNSIYGISSFDIIVPAFQATMMEGKMRELSKPVEIIIFKGEGHGFHLAETI
ncbi:hypothetical protein SEUCBS139899_008474 [Sporothrix eucalyptigena]|uniref:Peptidase S9 prolyl oligopeptidase catalytic domain-containing protein n=1 Tax=Sporothrix eucalyptigena TaxID=1812306 RepID=A0ABP0C9H5_9PEZI